MPSSRWSTSTIRPYEPAQALTGRTFINGEPLSRKGDMSDPFELKSDDIVESSSDIVGEDNNTIILHKVAARIMCVFTEQDAQVAARVEQY
ncbi:hypothetical protein CVT25_008621 [Psilocybe cyanescens]|uniref:FHA domain-containing protein n=1 Tax=Psilocybe cyanescens TaxID=93625 RepID=A0A409XDE4_PSICY|nr:hypothetical protein CVT25_008621 [Psilocybe cyanescens]